MYVLASFIAGVWVVNIFTTIFQCRPISAAWNIEIQPADKQCMSVMKVYYFSTAFSILTDLLLCIIPLPLLWKLKLPRREKVIVTLIFGLGLFASVASIMRITVLHDVQNIDATIGTVPTLNWSVAEVGTGCICASLPCLKPLIKKLLPGVFFQSARRPGNTGPGLSGKVQSHGQSHGTVEEVTELTEVPPSRQGTSKGILKHSTAIGTREFV